MSQGTIDQDRIEGDLEQARTRMGSRLTELKGRLSPGQVLDDVIRYFRGREGAEFARSLGQSVRSNPLPTALTGIGLTWLMASSARAKPDAVANSKVYRISGSGEPRWTSHEEFDRHIESLEQGVPRHANEDEAAHRTRLDNARGKAFGVVRQAQDTAESFSQRVQDALSASRQSTAQTANDLRSKTSDVATRIGDSAQSAVQNAGDGVARGSQAARQLSGDLLTMLTNNPVVLGAAGLAIGALLGAFVPKFEQEEAALGGVAGEARTSARTLAQKVLDRGEQAAQQALDAGRDSARVHGLTDDKTVGNFVDEALSGELSGNVKHVVQDVLKATDEGLQKKGADQTKPLQAGTSANPTQAQVKPGAAGLPSSSSA